MRAITIQRGQGFVLAERPALSARRGEVVVNVHAAGLNSADLRQLQGFYDAPAGWPADITGLEIAGVISSVGDGVDGFAVGDRVMALIGGGGQAEQVVVPADLLIPLPDGVSLDHAGALMEGFATAWDALVLQAGVRAGSRVLVTGAAGGVGLSMVQVALVNGAFVTASVRNADAAAALTGFIDSDRLTVVRPGEEAANGTYDIIIDLVCGDGFLDRVGLLARGGVLVIVGILAPMTADVGIAWLGPLLMNRCTIIGTTIRGRSHEEKVALVREIERRVLPLIESGALRVNLDASFELSEYADAFAKLAMPGKLGKVVLLNRPPV